MTLSLNHELMSCSMMNPSSMVSSRENPLKVTGSGNTLAPSWASKGTTLVVLSMPILFAYRSPLPIDTFNLALFAYVAWSVVVLLFHGKVFVAVRDAFSPYIAYIAIFTPLALLLSGLVGTGADGSVPAILVRWLKCLYLLGTYYLLGLYRFFDREYAMRCLSFLGVITAVFLIIQHIANEMGMPFSNPLAIFYTESILLDTSHGGNLYRPSAFFDEPSTIALVFLPLVIKGLFSSREGIIVKELACGMLPIVLSFSGMGILAIFLLICISITWRLSKRPLIAAVLVVFTVFAVIALSNIESFWLAVDRIFTADTRYNAIAARSGSEAFNLFLSAPILGKVFGAGFGNLFLTSYTNGWLYCLVTLGVFGTMLLAVAIIRMLQGALKRNNIEKAVMLLMFVVLMFGVQLVEPIRFCFWFSCAGNNDSSFGACESGMR